MNAKDKLISKDHLELTIVGVIPKGQNKDGKLKYICSIGDEQITLNEETIKKYFDTYNSYTQRGVL